MLPKFRRAICGTCQYLCFWKYSCWCPAKSNIRHTDSSATFTTPKRHALLIKSTELRSQATELTEFKPATSVSYIPDRVNRLYKRRRKNNNHNKRSVSVKKNEVVHELEGEVCNNGSVITEAIIETSATGTQTGHSLKFNNIKS